jgi:D-alanyl-D-alanine carboxypeptidase/D-alanyl-D-alanine-endopeptidase (penicillin-binding protein 4)
VLAAFLCLLPSSLLQAAVPAAAADRSSVALVPKPVAAGAPWTASEREALRASLDAIVAAAPIVRGAHAGIVALETRSGAVLYARNAEEHFLPASTAKLVTGSAALARLGAGFRFTTEVRATGPLVEGELQGDLVLHGGGDPFLAAADLEAAAAAVASAGVRSIAGAVTTDSSVFEPKRYGDGWSVDDIPYDYMPVISALSLEENTVHLTLTPGPSPGDPALLRAVPALPPIGPASAAGVLPESGGGTGPASLPEASPAAGCPASGFPFRIVNRVTTGTRGTDDTVAVTREPCAVIAIVGSIPRDAPPDEIDAAVPSPEAYAAAVFRAALAARGIAVAEQARDAGPPARDTGPGGAARVLWTHASEPLSELLADFWYPSDNLAGEALLRALGAARGGPPGTDAGGLAAVREWLAAAGIPAGGIDLADGSGLSRYDLATPRALASVLQADWDAPYRDLILDSLPVAGVRGTLAHAFAGTPLERRVFAKSGSMTHASALAGYLATRRHGAVTFCVLVDDYLGEAAPLAELRARILTRIATD